MVPGGGGCSELYQLEGHCGDNRYLANFNVGTEQEEGRGEQHHHSLSGDTERSLNGSGGLKYMQVRLDTRTSW